MTDLKTAASATPYRSANIIEAIERAKERKCERLLLANRIGMVVEIMADDLLATIRAWTDKE